MARAPFATQRHLPERQPTIQVRGVIFHSVVGSLEAAYGHFLNSSDLESTFATRKNGEAVQFMESDERADANGAGNPYYASVEQEDNGDPNNDPLTEGQIDKAVQIGKWYHEVHGVPLKRIEFNGDYGFGYHVMHGRDHQEGGEWYKKGPSPWTGVIGKTCPGFIRQRQFDEIVLPRIIGETQEDPFMASVDDVFAELQAINRRLKSLEDAVKPLDQRIINRAKKVGNLVRRRSV